MAFSLSIAGVLVTITTSNDSSSSSNTSNASLSIKVRHCDDGHIEADLCNFSGTIALSPEQPQSCIKQQHQQHADEKYEVIVDGIPEELAANRSVGLVSNGYDLIHHHRPSLKDGNKFVPLSPRRSCSTPTIDTTDNEEDKESNVIESPPEKNPTVQFHASTTKTTHGANCCSGSTSEVTTSAVDLSLHEACASDEIEICELRKLLRSSPHLAAIQDEYGDYPAHVFARNESFIYTPSDENVQEFAYELYQACPSAFLSEGYDGQIP